MTEDRLKEIDNYWNCDSNEWLKKNLLGRNAHRDILFLLSELRKAQETIKGFEDSFSDDTTEQIRLNKQVESLEEKLRKMEESLISEEKAHDYQYSAFIKEIESLTTRLRQSLEALIGIRCVCGGSLIGECGRCRILNDPMNKELMQEK